MASPFPCSSTSRPFPLSGMPSKVRYYNAKSEVADTRNEEFIGEHPDYLPEGNAMQFLSDDGGETYNKCHCEFECIYHFNVMCD